MRPKMFILILVISFVSLLMIGCNGSVTPQRYVHKALAIMDKTALFAEGPLWDEAKKRALSSAPEMMDEAYEIVREALETAGGKHSFLMESSIVQYNDTIQWKMPAIEMTDDSILVITVPEFSGNETQAKQYAQTLQDGISSDARNVILDLRGNTGGNMYPMIAGVNALLPEGIILKFKKRHGREGMTKARELQSWLTARMGEFCEERGRKIIGWDEILEGAELSKSAAVMSWRGVAGGIKAAKEGHKVVMAPSSHMYIDYYQSEDHDIEPFNIGGYLPLERVYSYEPFDPQLTAEQCEYIMGVQANLWGEFVHDPNLATYMTYPRGLATAEIGWSDPSKKDWHDFRKRMATVLSALDRDQAPFRIPEPYGLKEAVSGQPVTLELPVDGSEIYFTLDGSDPQYKGSLYHGEPLTIDEGQVLKCTVKLPSGRYSMPYTLNIK